MVGVSMGLRTRGSLHVDPIQHSKWPIKTSFNQNGGLNSVTECRVIFGTSILYSFNRLHSLLSDHVDFRIIFSSMIVIATEIMSATCKYHNDKEAYKILSISSMVSPFVSGRQKYVQMVATIIHAAKKNHVP